MDIKLLYRLIKYLGCYKKDLVVVAVSLLCVSISLLLIGSVFRGLVDNGLTENYQTSINKSILCICLLIVILSISSFFRSYYINNVAEKVVTQIRKEAYSNLINYEIAEFEELKIGEIISRLTGDIDLIAKLIVNFLSFFIRNSVMLIGGIALMFFESSKLAAIVIITIPLLLIPLIKFGKHVKALSKKALNAQVEIVSNIEESFTNIRAIHAFNRQTNKIADFDTQTFSYLKHSASRLKIRALFFAVSIAVILAAITGVMWVGSMDIVAGKLSAGSMVSFIYYAIVAGVSSGGIFELLGEMHLPLTALERVLTFTNLDDKTNTRALCHSREGGNPAVNKEDKKGVQVALEFKNINFAYPSRPNLKIINDISFKISSGKFIGIVGRSGSGKTTLMQLLLKFYFPDSGLINVANQDISMINSSAVRDLIAYVPQEASIFSGTIRSNIIFAKPDATEEEIRKVTEITGITEFTAELSDGADTKIGERGLRLSGGQKQRIALARALLRNPQILLLDEAMSALDTMSEQKLLHSIKQLMKGRIILSIAHRISGIEHADNILVIDKGGLIAEGTHDNLLLTSEIYRLICLEQLRAVKNE
ncbi:ABC transporter transmembrane domain-containing protein [Rickettsia endosymbiont of Halotydeus destructor]